MDDIKRNVGNVVHNSVDTVTDVPNRDSAAPTDSESLADAVEGLRQDAGAQGRTLEQAEEQGVLEAGHDGGAATPGFFGDHRSIDDTNTSEDNR